MTRFTDLPPDALLHLLSLLPPCDAVSLGSTCRLLRTCVRQDSVWRQQCTAWVEGQRALCIRSAEAISPPQLLTGLRLPTYRALYSALHQLGSWPEGLFYSTDDTHLPRGRLLVCRLYPSSGSLQLLLPIVHRGAALGNGGEVWGLLPRLSIHAVPDSGGAQASLSVHRVTSKNCCLQLSLDGHSLLIHPEADRRSVPPLPGHRTLGPSAEQQPGSSASGPLARLAAYVGGHVSSGQVESLTYRRVSLPPARAAAQEGPGGEPVGMALLRRCQGVYYGSYGPHGMEVLSLTFATGEDAVPTLCPVSGPRLQALKLRGDANVPALKHSFVVDAASCRLGPYDPHTDDPYAPPGAPARPCLTFFQEATHVVALEERPVAARFRAVGCINMVPGQWNPQWVPATFLTYDSPMERTLTVVFEDEGEPFRHAIDLTEFPFAGGAGAAVDDA